MNAETLKVFVPLHMHQRGGRKVVIGPIGSGGEVAMRPLIENAMIKALARAYLWRRRIEGGEFASISELATAEGVNQSYACRLLRLTLLAPELVDAVIEGRHPSGMTLKGLMGGFSQNWSMQVSSLWDTCVTHQDGERLDRPGGRKPQPPKRKVNFTQGPPR
jgi:hypothetical protein